MTEREPYQALLDSALSDPERGADRLAAMPATTSSTCASSLRVYVCPETGIASAKPIAALTRRSSSRTFPWSPSNRSRNVACVPVVPFTPRQGSDASR